MKKKTLKLFDELPSYPKTLIKDAPSHGAFDAYADYIVGTYNIKADHDFIRRYLKDVGAWEASELLDEDTNVLRFLWITVLNAKEDLKS